MNFNSIKQRYLSSSLLLRIIYINIAVFVVLKLLQIFSFFIGGKEATLTVMNWVGVPSHLSLFIRRPWTILTYMFSHYGVFDILFNMLWLYWLGRVFLEAFNPKQLVGLYLMGGLVGAAMFVTGCNLQPVLFASGPLMGASAAVLAVVLGISVYRPDYKIGLLFFGAISLKWVAIATVVIYLVSFDGVNVGGYVAHVGGMLTGLCFGLSIKRGHDITSWINRCIDAVVALFQKSSYNRGSKGEARSRQSKYKYKKSTSTSNSSGTQSQSAPGVDEERLDSILDKLKRSGYGALSDDEKEFLFNASRKR